MRGANNCGTLRPYRALPTSQIEPDLHGGPVRVPRTALVVNHGWHDYNRSSGVGCVDARRIDRVNGVSGGRRDPKTGWTKRVPSMSPEFEKQTTAKGGCLPSSSEHPCKSLKTSGQNWGDKIVAYRTLLFSTARISRRTIQKLSVS